MNRLIHASSPYLLQHRDNPVHWWEWGDAAFAAAKRLERPVILSVGYAACHWCHVMSHESFEDDGVAALMNALFVSIKVDREERPDVDHIYMSALHALGEQGGWPLTMFLTPDREPFWGGTYFPKTARYGRPGFGDLLKQVAAIYRAEPERIAHNTGALTNALAARGAGEPRGAEPSNADFLSLSAKAATAFDPVHGGLRGAPKFPNAPILNMLWRAGASDPSIRAPVLLTLDRMARGGIHDHLGGGFARYSVDEQWLVPHFEKMLYDNAQLLELYALATQLPGHPDRDRFRDAMHGIVAWLNREMIVWPETGPTYASHSAFRDSASPPVGFASSLDADSEGEEGRFYVWSRSEIESILLPDDAARFARVYDITEEGNFEGRNIPNRLRDHPASESDHQRLALASATLRVHRDRRVHPGRDDKVLTDWNGLMITALARAGAAMRQENWIATARGVYRFLRSFASRDGRMAHSWRGDIGVWPAFALDQAAMALAALALAEIDGDPALLADAKSDLDVLARHYSEGESLALAMTADDGDRLIVRPRPTHDDAVPNANGLYAEALIRHAAMAMDDQSLARADALFRELGGAMRGEALAHASLWSALDLRLNAAHIVIAGPAAEALHRAALMLPWPERIIVRTGSIDGLPTDHPARAMAGAASDSALAFVCVGQRCSFPVEDPESLAATVAAMRTGDQGPRPGPQPR